MSRLTKLLDDCRLNVKASIETRNIHSISREETAKVLCKENMARVLVDGLLDRSEVETESADGFFYHLSMKGYYFTPQELGNLITEIRNIESISDMRGI